MKDIQLIFFDIDGTLVDPRTGRISEKTKETLLRLHGRGIKLCIATGRPPASLPDLDGLPFDAFLTVNGSLCYTKDQIIFHHPIAPEDVQKVIANAAAIGRPVSIAIKDRLVANGIDQDLADYYRLAGLELTADEDFDDACREPVYQIMLGCRRTDEAAITQGIDNISLAWSWDRAVDVIPTGSGKGEAISKILEHFHLTPAQAMAFGDAHNDIQMLRAVGMGVAMGNAAPEIKAAADAVCGCVWDEGIFHFCEENHLTS